MLCIWCKIRNFNQCKYIEKTICRKMLVHNDTSCMHSISWEVKPCNVDARYSHTREYAKLTTHNHTNPVCIDVSAMSPYAFIISTIMVVVIHLMDCLSVISTGDCRPLYQRPQIIVVVRYFNHVILHTSIEHVNDKRHLCSSGHHIPNYSHHGQQCTLSVGYSYQCIYFSLLSPFYTSNIVSKCH